ncbi:hypothetical protein AOLI_G00308920 [Acnodon oligacanthus]
MDVGLLNAVRQQATQSADQSLSAHAKGIIEMQILWRQPQETLDLPYSVWSVALPLSAPDLNIALGENREERSVYASPETLVPAVWHCMERHIKMVLE